MSHACSEYQLLSRRGFLRGAGALLGTALLPAWLPRVALAAEDPAPRDVIVSIYLRGGSDGLSLCVPHGDPHYYKARPTLSVPPPDSNRPKRGLDLDGFFAFPAALAQLLPAFRAGECAVVHATGAVANRWSRSHFDAQRWMDVGKPSDSSLTSGWLARHLASVTPVRDSAALRGVSLNSALTESLRGGPHTLPVPDVQRFAYDGGWPEIDDIVEVWTRSYAAAPDPLRLAAEQTRETLALLRRVDVANYRPGGQVTYPTCDLGRALKSAAALIRAEVGVEAIAVDTYGWDTHDDQGTMDGYLGQLMTDLAQSLAAFHGDLHAAGTRYTVVVMSEFGRSVAENESLGTEHGTGNAMLLLGPAVMGGKVHGTWPGLHPDQLFERQDLRVTTDYRDVLSEVLMRRLHNPATEVVFPEFRPHPLNVVRSG